MAKMIRRESFSEKPFAIRGEIFETHLHQGEMKWGTTLI